MTVTLTHREFPAPRTDTQIWRYSSFTKLLSLATSGKLFMPSVPTLRKDDPFEGIVSPATVQFGQYLRGNDEMSAKIFGAHIPVEHRRTMADNYGADLGFASLWFLSCWHQNQHESAALWKLYSGISEGVAVRSTVQRLADSMDKNFEFTLGPVTYRDYSVDLFAPYQALTPVFTKRHSFAHERELRLLYWGAYEVSRPEEERQEWAKGRRYDKLYDLPAGLSFNCNVNRLVEEVVVSPYADDWVVETIAATLRQVGCAAPVRKSNLLKVE